MQILEDTAADARAPGLAGSARFTYGWLARWIIANTEPPSRHRCKAPQAFVPKTGQPAGAVLAGFCQLQQQLSRQLQGTAGLDLSCIKARAPWNRRSSATAFMASAAGAPSRELSADLPPEENSSDGAERACTLLYNAPSWRGRGTTLQQFLDHSCICPVET